MSEPYMVLRGDGKNINRYRVSNDDNSKVHLYLDVSGEHTLAELLAKVEEQGATAEDVTFRGGCYTITVPATEEDVARWEKADADWVEKTRQQRREWYKRLRAEFEGEA